MTAGTQPRRLRADAARNRRLLLDTAAATFAECGTEVSIAEIARRAGTGKGTVFRHFANKDELIAAIVCDQLDRLSAAGTALLEAVDPTRGFRPPRTACSAPPRRSPNGLGGRAGYGTT
ncbi:TetR/AcrR family transcriptional regulator [Frankia gtarii]|uniref:TetR/AcrR family transcriptional regulator n=1 Tax=Frankia gtarii TaxID=2950102 RepID=UPI0021C14E15|nr:helix-turn-helix domain-containing protein [Frankia gtarii]